MRSSVRIAGLDSGKSRDSSALVGIRVEENKVKILNAKRWRGRNYLDVEAEIAAIHRKAPFNFYMVEMNSVGVHVFEVLKYKYNLPAFSVTTSKDIKDPKKITSDKTMDKNLMVKIMLEWFADETLIFPAESNPELDELKRQLSIFAEHKTNSGTIAYYAEGSEHDDLVMALMLACFKARAYLTPKKSVVIATSKKFMPAPNRPNRLMSTFGSGVPEHLRRLQSKEWSILYPSR